MTPRAARDEIVGWQGEVLRVRVTAPPVGGAANTALVRLLAEALDVPKGALRIVRGATGREKVVAVADLERAAVLRRIAQVTADAR